MNALHPLRPKEGIVLICEGPSDLELIQTVLGDLSRDIVLYAANGKDNLPMLTSLMRPRALYIRDRDFDFDTAFARASLADDAARTIWPHYDIESYLLHPDWIFEAVEAIRHAPVRGQSVASPPAHEAEIEDGIRRIATNLCEEYACRRTLAELNRDGVGNLARYHASVSGTLAMSLANVLDAAKRLRQQGEKLNLHPELTDAAVSARYDRNLASYRSWAGALNTVRHEFSGKTILDHFAKEIGIKWGKPDRPGSAAKGSQERLARQIRNRAAIYLDGLYTQTRAGFESDARLGDFGLLVQKASRVR